MLSEKSIRGSNHDGIDPVIGIIGKLVGRVNMISAHQTLPSSDGSHMLKIRGHVNKQRDFTPRHALAWPLQAADSSSPMRRL